MRSQENDIVSATEEIIETQVVEKLYYNYSKRIIKKTTIKLHFTLETIAKLNVTSMNFLESGFQYLYKTILSIGMKLEYSSNKIAQISNWFT